MKARVFIGSSKESIQVMETIAAGLEGDMAVVRWTDRKVFPAGEFILNSLLKQVQAFDFAVMVFGPDDVVISRRQRTSAPRDNVVFELGLFMSRLEHHRALVVAPFGSRTRIKILSDLAGLNPVVYTPPTKRGHNRAALKRALAEAVAEIRDKVKEIGPKPAAEVLPYEGPRDVLDAAPVVTDLLSTAIRRGEPANVQNIALDMEVTWHIIHHRVLANHDVNNVTWRSLMVDPNSKEIQNVASPSVSLEIANQRVREIQKVCSELQYDLAERKVTFECRAYSNVPVIHGFLVNGSALLLTLTGMGAGKLIGAPNPYWRFVRRPEDTAHLFGAYSQWFDHIWGEARKIWPR
jgi:hypothetical protein